MTKAELNEKMASDASIAPKEAERALASFMAAVIENVKSKEGKVTLTGFGSLLALFLAFTVR